MTQCVGTHRRMLLMRPSLLHQQCRALLVHLTWMVSQMGGERTDGFFLWDDVSRTCSKQHAASLSCHHLFFFFKRFIKSCITLVQLYWHAYILDEFPFYLQKRPDFLTINNLLYYNISPCFSKAYRDIILCKRDIDNEVSEQVF